MKDVPNSGTSEKDLKRGYCDGEYPADAEDAMDDSPPNDMYSDWDDGGFLGRIKGGER